MCCELPANDSFKANKLVWRLETKHDYLVDRGTEFLKVRLKFKEN